MDRTLSPPLEPEARVVRAYILSAGLGTRLYPITDKTPKVMLPIGQRPLLWYQIKLASFYGFDEIIVNLHKNAKKVSDYFGDGKDLQVKILYAYEKKLLGTAGSVKRAQNFFDKQTFLVLYGDTFRNTNLKKLCNFHLRKKGICTILLYQTDEPWTQGIIEINKNNQVLSFVEKPKRGKERSNLSNAGVLICEPKIFDYIQPDKFSDFGADVLPNLAKIERVFAVKTGDYTQDIGTPEHYQKAQDDFAKGKIKFPFKID